MPEDHDPKRPFSFIKKCLIPFLCLLSFALLTSNLCSAADSGAYSRAAYVLPPDLVKRGFSFADVKIPLERQDVVSRVFDQINYLLMDRKAGMMEWFDRLAVYGPTIKKVLEDEKVPADLIYLPMLQSDLMPNSRSRSGGIGWWALGNAKDKKESAVPWVQTNDWDDRRDPVLSTRIACTLLQTYARRNQSSDWLLTICAFVDGSDKIEAVVTKSPGFGYWDLVMPHYSEILIPRLVALKIISTHREFYGVDVPPLPSLAYHFMDRLKLSKELPLYVVADWCGTNPRSLWEMNPGVDPSTGVLPKPDKRSPSGFPLRVPKGKETKVRELLVREGYLAP
jgi:membrane-bound lytic murein transglycosylase D